MLLNSEVVLLICLAPRLLQELESKLLKAEQHFRDAKRARVDAERSREEALLRAQEEAELRLRAEEALHAVTRGEAVQVEHIRLTSG